jgi:polyhydroxybutyrate depolymerase
MRTAAFVGVAIAFATACAGSNGHSGPGSRHDATTTVPALLASPGCGGAATTLTAGETKVTIDSAGSSRWYFRHVPPAHDGIRPVPVVIDLHGYTEGATVHTMMSQLGAFGDKRGFVTVTPQGSGKVARWDTGASSPDMVFIGGVLDDVGRTMCVDPRRIFVTGLSNGAFMASAVACAYSSRVAAIAPVAGVRDISPCPLARPVPIIAFHGTADPLVTYTGGFGPKVAGLPAPDGSGKTIGEAGAAATFPTGPSIPEIMARWASRDGCGTIPTTQTVAADVSRLSYPCQRGVDVELYRVQGGGHAWPGSALSAQIANVIGPTTMSISADELMWAFFQAHPLPASQG